jgi:NAD+ kinase
MVSVKIFANQRKAWASTLARSLARFLQAKGIAVRDSGVGTTICVGGDGTIFHYFHYNQIRGSILGIGSKTSSVCQFQHEKLNLLKLVHALKHGKTAKRLTLRAVAPPLKKPTTAINDVVVHSHDYRVIKITLQIGKKKSVFEGDGLIISSPLGTSGYAYSAGAVILPRSSRKITIAPICPYMRTVKPIVVGENATISVSSDRSADLIIDGIYYGRLQSEQKVLVKKGKDVEFLEV